MHDGNAPSWLFSFVDLAFLLLIAMTQLGGDGSEAAVELGEIVVPQIRSDVTQQMPDRAAERWQLRVHPPAEAAATPFELVRNGGPEPSAQGALLDESELRERLASLHSEDVAKPLLAPHEDSRSRDMLAAVGLLEEHWPSRRRATVLPLFGAR